MDNKNDKDFSVIVIGDGIAASFCAAQLAHLKYRVHWIAGTQSHPLPPLPMMEAGPTAALIQKLAADFELEIGTFQTGSFLREFKGQAFRIPSQEKTISTLWSPEKNIAPAQEGRFGMDFATLVEAIRKKTIALDHVTRIEQLPVKGFLFENEELSGVQLGNGTEIRAPWVIYADFWSKLSALEGLPKNLPFIRSRAPSGILQAIFRHVPAVAPGIAEGFMCPLTRESGEEGDRHVFGYFMDGGERSIWTLVLTDQEAEDNHQIAKKYRRLKGALEKMFSGTTFLPQDVRKFFDTVKSEQVRFEPEACYGRGLPPAEPIRLNRGKDLTEGLIFLTDGYGPSRALEQVASLLTLGLGMDLGSQAQAEKIQAPDIGDITQESMSPPA